MWLSKTWNRLVFLHVFLSFYVHIQIFFRMSSCKPFADILEPVSRKKFFPVLFFFFTPVFCFYHNLTLGFPNPSLVFLLLTYISAFFAFLDYLPFAFFSSCKLLP